MRSLYNILKIGVWLPSRSNVILNKAKNLNNTDRKVSSLKSNFNGLGTAIGAAFSVAAITQFGKSIFTANVEFDRLRDLVNQQADEIASLKTKYNNMQSSVDKILSYLSKGWNKK